MGSQLVWQNRFNIGVEMIDREHRKLFGIMNKLLMFQDQDGKSQWVCQEGIKYFKDHAMKHFSEEEVYMASISYDGFETHRRLHDDFRKKTLPALEKELERTGYSEDAVGHFLSVCAGWLIGHTLTEDRAIVGKTTSKWGNLLPEEEQIVIRKTISQLLNDMFQLSPKVISDHYGGEKFGKGIYYRLIYGTKEGQKWEVILVFEEKLLVGTLGKLLGSQSRRLDVELVNATRFAARQFVERIRESLSNLEQYEFQAENLLTYEQFQRVFEKQHPKCSLLFDTGEGYFAYCTITPQKISEGNEVSLKTENAVEEVAKYLKQKNKKEEKKEILVVDDSDTVLQSMKMLLGGDYQVTLAKSGLAAIRCMTLNRPDLVLLDYEMPVCDGPQVLQMIRSEEGFADIDVIFLTSRVDKESLNKVIPLRPAGYLLKSLKPDEIKKNIDAHFKK